MDNIPDRYANAVAGRVGEDVLAVASFVRTGLPQRFLLAVTATRVHAFAYASRGVGLRVEAELACWDRATLRTEIIREPDRVRVRLVPPAGAEVACECQADPLTEPVLGLLA